MAEISLAKGFAPAGEAAWRAVGEEALKGTPFAALKAKTYDGIAVQALYGRGRGGRSGAGRARGRDMAGTRRGAALRPRARGASARGPSAGCAVERDAADRPP